MPGSILVVWPRDGGEIRDVVATARGSAPEREPTSVMVAGGNEPATVGDVRLDGRERLRHDLGLPTETDDVALIDAAFGRWGERFPRYVSGDFAWARWDPGARELVLIRDHLGIRPLLYARYAGGFAAATDIRCLRALPGVEIGLDPLYVAMYLTDIFVSSEHTIHAGVRRLPPGHLMRVLDHGATARIGRYWHLSRDELRLPSEADYLDRFRATFVAAVRDRVPSEGLVATELSGGLDSTIVTAATAEIASPRRILTLAASFSQPRYEGGATDEGRHRDWAREDERIELLEVPGGTLITTDAIETALRVGGIPAAQIMDLVRLQLWRTARDRGASIVLDGLDGDTTINYGFERWMAMVRSLQIRALARELRASYGVAGRRGVREAAILLGYSTYHRVRRRFRRPAMVTDSVATEALLRESGFLDRLDSLEMPTPGDVRGENILDLMSSDSTFSIERCEIAAAAAGVEVRHPFFDRRLAELAVSLPANLLFRDRMPRWIERRALAGFGPEEVLWRHDKGKMPRELLDDAFEATGFDGGTSPIPDALHDWVDRAALMSAMDRWSSNADVDAAYAAYPAMVLMTWAGGLNRAPHAADGAG